MTAASAPLSRSDASTPTHDVAVVSDGRTLEYFATAAMALLPIMTFTIPGRPSPSSLSFLDPLAMFKLVILAFVCGGGAFLLWFHPRQRLLAAVVSPLMPMIAFLAWGITSALWSPLKAVTIGQAGGLAALLIYAIAIGMICYDERMVPRILQRLSIVMLAFNALILAVHLIDPLKSGLDRSLMDIGADGIVHPTASGAAASLGLLLLLLCRVVGRLTVPNWLLFSGLIIHLTILYLSNSRAATLLLAVAALMVWFLFSENGKRAVAMIAAALLMLAVVSFDPGLESVSEITGAGAEYLARGQSAEDLRRVSGRAEMWSAIWNEFLKSPIIGHGYFVTSETGLFKVWGVVANHTAHNIHLQVLASTGIVGMLLFVLSMLGLGLQFLQLRGRGDMATRVGWMVSVMAFWFAGWSLACVSFLGPVRAESVVFFTMVGVGIGQSLHLTHRRQSTLGARPPGSRGHDQTLSGHSAGLPASESSR